MSMFKDYLHESIKEYSYRIKAICVIDDDALDKLDSVLRKYDLLDISNVHITQLQEHPLEFYNERNKQVYIVDVTLGMPISSYVLRSELQEVLNTYESAIIVRAENDPIELQTQEIENKKDKEYETKLSTNSEYNEDEQIHEDPAYGDDYNKKFLSRIERAQLKIKSEVKSDNAEFNKGHDGVIPHYGKQSKDSSDVAKTGNFDDTGKMKNGAK